MDLGGLQNPDLLLLPAQDPNLPPGLTKILQNLGEILGGEGLSPPLQQQLQQARVSLGRARGLWLHLELLWRILGELSRDPQNFPPEVLLSLEQELTWAQVSRGSPKFSQLVPRPQPLLFLPVLLPELRRRLVDKHRELLDFLKAGNPKIPPNPPKNPPQNSPHPPKTPNPPNSPQNPPQNPPRKGPNLGALLRSRRLRLHRERLRERLLRDRVRRMDWEYPQVLSRCRSLLAQLGSLGSVQAHLDGGRGRYLQAKGGASLLKSRLEELRILLDTYPAPTIEAHRRIRALLSEARQATEAEAAILRAELDALRGLGPEFRALALELGEIRQESARKRWALRQLRPPPP